MDYLFSLVTLVCGIAVGWFAARARFYRQDLVHPEEYNKVTEARTRAEAAWASFEAQKKQLELELEQVRKDFFALNKLHGAKEEEARALLGKLNEQQEEIRKIREEFSKEFELLANRIFEEKSQKFADQNRSNLDVILNPLKEKIKTFEEKVEQVYKAESAERNSLRGEIKNLVETSTRISNEANNLTKALKGDQKKQGNWGELILDKVLERSGLTEGIEYSKQESLMGDDNRRLQPDAIVYLPEKKHILIDAKVSLVAYDQLVNAETDEAREQFTAAHLLSLKNHIKGLSEKNYPGTSGINAPDFVLMFIPIESSFSVAVQKDAELFNYAWDRKIVLVSPSTLLATLRTIASLWKQERQTRNVLEIAEESGKMYDKFVGFVEDLISIGKRMDDSKRAYEDAMKKLSEGSGNLVRRAELIRKLGAKHSKDLPPALVERAEKE